MSGSHVQESLAWTLGEVEIRRFDADDQRCLLLRAPDYDMWEHGGEIQAVCTEELDELIARLQAQREWMAGSTR